MSKPHHLRLLRGAARPLHRAGRRSAAPVLTRKRGEGHNARVTGGVPPLRPHGLSLTAGSEAFRTAPAIRSLIAGLCGRPVCGPPGRGV